MLPVDCLRHVITYCRLRARFVWSTVHRDFAFGPDDWRRFGEHYQTRPTRAGVKALCQRKFGVQVAVQRRTCHLWSSHLREPFQVWSPWTPGKFCTRYSTGAVMLFRQFPFVNFVRNVSVKFKLKTPMLGHDRVSVRIWNKTIPMVYISKTHKTHKVHISSAFKRFAVARVLLVFHVRENVLRLHPRRLEFLT